MEFLTTKQKKKKAQRLYFGYVLLSILVLLATYVLISTALGFEIFSSKGEVVQNGLLFVDSRPDGADIYMNGKKESDRTNSKFTVPEAEYAIQLKKAGFRDWEGTVSLMGGTVEFLTYPRLMPVVPNLITSRVVSSPPATMQSRDKRWVASYFTQSPTTIEIADLDNPLDPIVTVAVPPAITVGKSILSLKFIEWAGDNEHFMVALELSDTSVTQYVVMHRLKPDQIINVTALYNLANGDTVGFWDGKKDRVYIRQASGTILVGNLKDNSLASQPLFTDLTVEFFPISKERAIYTTKAGADTVVRYYSDQKTFAITTMKDPSKQVIAKSFGFNRNDYILLAGEGFEKTLIYKNFENAVTSSVTGRVAPFFIFPAQSKIADASRSNRFVLGSDGVNAQVYDIEQKELFRYELPASRPADIGWFDDARLYSIGTDQKLSVFDFTGRNVYEIAMPTFGKPHVNTAVNKVLYVTKTEASYTANIVDIESPTE